MQTCLNILPTTYLMGSYYCTQGEGLLIQKTDLINANKS